MYIFEMWKQAEGEKKLVQKYTVLTTEARILTLSPKVYPLYMLFNKYEQHTQCSYFGGERSV